MAGQRRRRLAWIASARFQRDLNIGLAVVFSLQIPVALATGLKHSVPYLVFLSLWALVASHWATAQAADAALKAETASNSPS